MAITSRGTARFGKNFAKGTKAEAQPKRKLTAEDIKGWDMALILTGVASGEIDPTVASQEHDRARAQAMAAPDHPPGVTYDAGNIHFACGQVLARHDRSEGVTPAMADEVGVLSGRNNHKQDLFYLRNAWHTIRGYGEVFGPDSTFMPPGFAEYTLDDGTVMIGKVIKEGDSGDE